MLIHYKICVHNFQLTSMFLTIFTVYILIANALDESVFHRDRKLKVTSSGSHAYGRSDVKTSQ